MKAPHCLVSLEVIEAMCTLAAATPAGCFLEVGVYHGGTAWHLAKLAREQHRTLYLYDTFSGIPYRDEIDVHQVGDFGDTSIDQVREAIPDARIIPGVFPGSAVHMGPVAFAHLDCDQYRSYRDALEYLDKRMVAGGVIWCDDVGCLSGATAAVREFCLEHGRRLIVAEKHYIRY